MVIFVFIHSSLLSQASINRADACAGVICIFITCFVYHSTRIVHLHLLQAYVNELLLTVYFTHLSTYVDTHGAQMLFTASTCYDLMTCFLDKQID